MLEIQQHLARLKNKTERRKDRQFIPPPIEDESILGSGAG